MPNQRVIMTYPVTAEQAEPEKEIPFVVSVLSGNLGNGRTTQGDIADRELASISPTNFKRYMTETVGTLTLEVPDKLSGKPGQKRKITIDLGKAVRDGKGKSPLGFLDDLTDLVDAVPELAQKRKLLEGIKESIAGAASNKEKAAVLYDLLGHNKGYKIPAS